jgi:mannonate dehydratase
MDMTLRWFGSGYDSVTLEQIRQIPGVDSVITTLYGKQPGEVWQRDEIRALKDEVERASLSIRGIESVNVHDAIKAGTADRDRCIDSYIETLANLGEEDIHLVCYNFMPVFDWTRTDLQRPRPDGSTVMAFDGSVIAGLTPDEIFGRLKESANGFMLPGWEPERMATIKQLFAVYESVDAEALFANLVYFLKAIMPVCDRYGIEMAIHPDDPAWPVFGLPRIVTDKDSLLRIVGAVDDVHNGVTLCSGSLGSSPRNDVPDIIRTLPGRIHFAHVRNVRYNTPDDYEEAAHLSRDGSLDMFAIMQALHDIGFNGPIRPDHGRAIWGEVAMPGYGLYDRALGATYLNGLWEAIEKSSRLSSETTDKVSAHAA